MVQLARRFRQTLTFGVLIGCQSCRPRAPAPSDAPFFARLELQDTSGVRDEERTVVRAGAPAAVEDWRVSPETVEVEIRETDAGRRWYLRDSGPHRLHVPIHLDPDEANRLTLHVAAEDDMTLRAALYRAGEVLWASRERVYVHKSGDLQAVHFALRTDEMSAPADEAVILARGVRAGWSVAAVEGRSVPLARYLARAGEQAQLIRCGSEWRRGWGLAHGAALETEAEVTAPCRLSFSAGWPTRIPQAPPEAHLLVAVTDDEGARQEHRVPLPEAAEDGWRSAELPLPEGRVRLQFSLATQSEGAPVAALGEPVLFTPERDPPTVLLITSDTHRADHLGDARLGVDVHTPVLDALAARGVLFEDCFSTSDVTIPSHIAILTGLHPRDTGVLDNVGQLPEDLTTLAEVFSAAGFATFASTSVRHLGATHSGLGQGFDRMTWPGDEMDARESARQIETWLPDAEGRRLFAWLHLYDAHAPYDPEPPWDRMNYPEDADPYDTDLPQPEFPVPAHMEGVRDRRWIEAQYRGEISYLDEQLKPLLDVPRIRNGIVAVTADHGESLGQQGIYWRHASVYPDSLHVPLILAFPGAPAGKRIGRAVSNADLSRTLLDLAGCAHLEFPGDHLLDDVQSVEQPRYAIATLGGSASMTVGRWHLVLHLQRYLKNRDSPERVRNEYFERHKVELYDREQDPACERDLSRSEKPRAKRMRALLIEWLGDRPDTGPPRREIHDPEMEQHLASFGYVDSGAPSAETTTLIDPECACTHCEAFR